MDRTKYEAAHQLYQGQNYRKAARLFLEAADEGTPLENGMTYHGAGNCFMRLKRYHDAIVVYEQALRDDSYQKRGTVENNLANAYLQNGDLSQAIAHFEAALNESSMYEPYKCYQGLAHAYFEQQAYEQAALAYKNAALDERNPNPGAALVNLGLCMMALNRPKSAAEAYSAALGVEGYNNRGKALANLGMAYYANKDYTRAQRALEEAQVMHHYQLSPAAAEVLAACKQQTGHDETSELEEESTAPDPGPVPAPVWQGEEEGAVAQPAPDAPAADQAPAPEPEPQDQSTGQIGPIEEVDSFFALSEKEIARQSKQELRSRGGVWRWLKPLLIAVLVIVILSGAALAVVRTGFGIPSTNTTISRLFDAYNTGGDYESYWTADTKDIRQQMSALPLPSRYTIDKADTSAATNAVSLTVTAGSSTKLKFVVTLKRAGLGWKVAKISSEY